MSQEPTQAATSFASAGPRPPAVLAPTPTDKIKITFAVLGTLLGVGLILVMIAILAKTAVTPPLVAGVKTPGERVEMLRAARAADAEMLGTYGWVDREKGVVRIPIEQAIQAYIAKPATGATDQGQ